MNLTVKSSFNKAQNVEHHSPVEQACLEKHALILMSETGGGHRAAAEAIQEGLQFLYGDEVRVTIVDAWKDHIAWPVNLLAGTYSWIVHKALWLWQVFWRLEKKPALMNIFYIVIYPLVAPGLLRLFKSRRPSVIVSVHPVLTPFALLVLERANINIPFITVVTDMIKSWHIWYQASTTLCLVPTCSIREQAVSLRISPAKIDVVGQPVSLKFKTRLEDKALLRHKLGFDPCRPVALLAGGGEGYGAVFEIARCIAQRVTQAQLIIVAGRNKLLQTKLEAVDWEVPTRVFGFVTNMPELMQAADVFVTKAGPGCLAEAFVSRLPLIIFDFIPGQEDHNVCYVQQHNAGVYVPDPEEIADLLRDWLRPDNPALTQMAHNAAGLAQPEAALAIARRVYGLITET